MADPLDPTVTEAIRSWRVQQSAGIEASAALELAASVCYSPAASTAFMNASRASIKGEGFQKLVDCLREFLSEGERAVILAGFKSGRADECLDAVTAQRDLWFRARKEIRAKLVLPMAVLFVAAFVAPLPGLFAEGATVFGYFFKVSIPLLLALGFWRVGHRMMEARTQQADTAPTLMDSMLLKIPVVRNVEQKRNVSDFASILSLQLSAGVPITEGLDVCARCLVNGFYRVEVRRASSVVKTGETLSSSIRTGELWPAEFVAMLGIGEKSGRLDDQLAVYAERAREAYTRAVQTFAEWLPRVVYGFVMLYVAWQIISMYMGYIGLLNDAMKP